MYAQRHLEGLVELFEIAVSHRNFKPLREGAVKEFSDRLFTILQDMREGKEKLPLMPMEFRDNFFDSSTPFILWSERVGLERPYYDIPGLTRDQEERYLLVDIIRSIHSAVVLHRASLEKSLYSFPSGKPDTWQRHNDSIMYAVRAYQYMMIINDSSIPLSGCLTYPDVDAKKGEKMKEWGEEE